MTQEELNKLADLLKGSDNKLTKIASVQKEQQNIEKYNNAFYNLMKQGPFGQKKAAATFSQALKLRVPYDAITPKIFAQDNISNNIAWADVEFPEIGAVKIPYKGAPARIERGPSRVTYDTHTAAINWSVTYDQIFTAAYNTLDEAKNKVSIGLALELDADLFKVMNAAGNNGVYTSPLVSVMSLDVVNAARSAQMAFSLITQAVIMHPTRYYQMVSNINGTNVDQVTLNSVISSGYVSQLFGVKFIISKLCPVDKAYAIPAPEYLGKYVLRQQEQIKITDKPWKMEYVVTGYSNYGIVLHNIPGVYPINFTPIA